MKSKRSVFNGALFKKDAKRFWVLTFLYACGYLVLSPLLLSFSLRAISMEDSDAVSAQLYTIASSARAISHPVITFFAVVPIMLCVFSYLFQTRSSNMTHAFPLTRGTLFMTHTFSALCMLLLPQVLTTLVLTVQVLPFGVKAQMLVWGNLLLALINDLLFFSIMSICVMVTGTWFMAPALYVIANFFYCGLQALYCMLAQFSYGAVPDFTAGTSFLTPVVRLIDTRMNVRSTVPVGQVTRMEDMRVALGEGFVLPWYLLVAVVLFAISYLIYRMKAVETAGDMLSIRWLKPLFRWLGAFSAASIAAYLILMLHHERMFSAAAYVIEYLLYLLLFGVIAFFLIEMLLEKKVRVFTKKKGIEAAAFLLGSLLALCLFRFDVFGIYRPIPETEDIEKVTVYITDPGMDEWTWEDAAAIDTVRRLHAGLLRHSAYILEQEKALGATWGTSYDISISYRKTNGKEVKRSYHMQGMCFENMELRELTADYLALFDDPEIAKQQSFTAYYQDVRPITVSWNHIIDREIYDENYEYVGGYYGEDMLDLSLSQLQEIYEALLTDLDDGAGVGYSIITLDDAEEQNRYQIAPVNWEESSTSLNFYFEYTGAGEPVEAELFDEGVGLLGIPQYYGYRRFFYDEEARKYRMNVSVEISESFTHTVETLVRLGVAEDRDALFSDDFDEA